MTVLSLTAIINGSRGHSLVWLMVHTFKQSSAFRLYDKTAGRSKIDLAIERLSSLNGSELDRCVCVVPVPNA
ncbi:hypothetical protein B4113_0115 [Geobacillus sp. B4113_201601]|nr:hypothetical protein B4113_0115 [Geobacillus sp. B4113_201601]